MRRRDRLRGHPQERQHSAAVRRKAGPSAPGEEHNNIFLREAIVTRRAETRHPAMAGSAGLGERQRVEPDRY